MSIVAQEIKASPGTRFQFQDVCVKCAMEIHFDFRDEGVGLTAEPSVPSRW